MRCEDVPVCVQENANRVMTGIHWLGFILAVNLIANLGGRLIDLQQRGELAAGMRNIQAMRMEVRGNQRMLQLLEDERAVQKQRLNALTDRLEALRREVMRRRGR